MRPVFNNATLQSEFEDKGYVVVDFLAVDEVKALSDAYGQLQGDLGEPAFASTIMSRDTTYRSAVSTLIANSFARALDTVFHDAQFFWGNFNVKYPSPARGRVPLHQDPSFLDERIFGALGIWVPLVDTVPENGALQVIPGSHTVIKQPRCGGRPLPYAALQESLLAQFGRPLLMRAGQAYIGSPALFHASWPNTSAQPRIVAAGLAGPKESELRYHHYTEVNGAGFAEMFAVDHDYYVTAPLFSRPVTDRYRMIETIPLDESLPAADELFVMLRRFGEAHKNVV